VTNGPPHPDEELTAGEAGDLVLRLAQLLAGQPVGSERAANSLRKLAHALRRSPSQTIDEFLASRSTKGKSVYGPRRSTLASQDLARLSLEQIGELLERDLTTKDLLMIGEQRFGIARSKLMRLSRDRVIESLRAAMNNEQSLDVIARSARQEGHRRLS
jgi:hypothetical protein